MATIQVKKPTTPGQRAKVAVVSELHKGKPHRALLKTKKRCSGRNNQGRITVRHRGGGHKRHIRTIDFKRADKDGVPARIERMEYDPNRTANIALILYVDGERRYILAPKKSKVNDPIMSGPEAPIKVGNNLPITNIPVGTVLHCVEMRPGKGAQIARSAGAYVQLLAKENGYATIRLRSGEMRRIPEACRATIGEVGNSEHNLQRLGKAGASRNRGRRPTVRGVAMNPVDHPMGGGEGRTSGGRHPCNFNGLVDGKITRKRNKWTNKWIVRSRRRAKEKRG